MATAKKNLRWLRGITLLEILITIIILSILILSSFLVLPSHIAKSRDATRKTNLHRVKTALNEYYYEAGNFPLTLPDCDQPLKIGNEVILNKIPCDPKTKSPYFYQINIGQPDSFRMYTNLENITDLSISFVQCQKGCGPSCQYNYGVSSSNILLENCLPPLSTPTTTLNPLIYACSPGGGSSNGRCDQFDNPEISLCPKVYNNDPTCNNECSDPKNRCKNAAGKHIPQ